MSSCVITSTVFGTAFTSSSVRVAVTTTSGVRTASSVLAGSAAYEGTARLAKMDNVSKAVALFS